MAKAPVNDTTNYSSSMLEQLGAAASSLPNVSAAQASNYYDPTLAVSNQALAQQISSAEAARNAQQPVGPASTTLQSTATGASGANVNPTISRNAADAAIQQLMAWGIITSPTDPIGASLINTINNLATTGAGADTISLAIQNSDAYKQRFSANQARIANGLPALSPADYIATEQAYNQVLNSAGIPTNSANNSASTWTNLLANDVSASELQSRVDLAKQSITQADPYYTATLQNLYGLTPGQMISYVLNPQNAVPEIQQQVNASQIAAEASRAGSGIGLPLASQLAGQGVTQAQANAGFQTIATQQPALQGLATLYGQGILNPNQVGQAQQAATFGTTVGGISAGQAQAQLQRLQAQQLNAFSGSAGASTGSLGAKDISGAL